jgi:glyoxylase-like metal-dependent hydrolase (beta-lactamase superfamily II)
MIRYAHGIHAIDTGYVRPVFDASHLIVHEGRAAFVDTGVSHSVPLLLAALDELALAPTAVDFVFLTHVHLDHAGGAGQLMQALPNAQAVLHPRGAPHMIDPGKLIEASIAVYGAEAYARLYGEILPIDAARVVATTPGQQFSLAGRRLEILHTPGHALHHQAIFDHHSRGVFTGDTFGLSYREFDVDGRALALPTTTPTQFDPDQLIDSIRRILALQPQAAYFTHYGEVRDLERIGADLERQIGEYVRIARCYAALDAESARQAIRRDLGEFLRDEVHRHGCCLSGPEVDALLENDITLNADGLLVWLSRRKS